MLRIRYHGVEEYEQLPRFECLAGGVLDGDDLGCLSELGTLLAIADSWRRFAVCLLHKHVVPRHGELFVEQSVAGEKRTETSPVRRSTLGRPVSPVTIRFQDCSGPAPQIVGLEYADLHPWEPTAAFCDEDEPVLAGIAHRLREYDKLDRFGLKLIRNHLHMDVSELVLETCDSGTRAVHCRVVPRTALLAAGSTVETTWQWRVAGGGPRVVIMRDCVAACVPVPGAQGPTRALNCAPERVLSLNADQSRYMGTVQKCGDHSTTAAGPM